MIPTQDLISSNYAIYIVPHPYIKTMYIYTQLHSDQSESYTYIHTYSYNILRRHMEQLSDMQFHFSSLLSFNYVLVLKSEDKSSEYLKILSERHL